MRICSPVRGLDARTRQDRTAPPGFTLVELLVVIAIAFTWKGYFAKTKSEQAAAFAERFGVALIGAFIGKTI